MKNTAKQKLYSQKLKDIDKNLNNLLKEKRTLAKKGKGVSFFY